MKGVAVEDEVQLCDLCRVFPIVQTIVDDQGTYHVCQYCAVGMTLPDKE